MTVNKQEPNQCHPWVLLGQLLQTHCQWGWSPWQAILCWLSSALSVCHLLRFLGLPHTGGLKTTEVYSLTVQEARSPKSRHRQGRFHPGVVMERLDHGPLLTSTDHWQCLAFLCWETHHFSLCLHPHIAFFPMSLSSLLVRIPVIGFGAHVYVRILFFFLLFFWVGGCTHSISKFPG